MALPMLVNGAECGPSNPLQSLSKRFDQDRGIQQDHFGARAGSSRETFRTQLGNAAHDQDAAKFFGASPSPALQLAAHPSPLELSGLYVALPSALPMQQRPAHVGAPGGAWASDFLQRQQQTTAPQLSAAPRQEAQIHSVMQEQAAGMTVPSGVSMTSPVGMQPWMGVGVHHMPPPDLQAFRPSPISIADQSLWDKEFQSQEISLSGLASAAPREEVVQQPALPNVGEADDLARTAALLVETVKDEQNPKFQNSQFMGLMRQLRDRQAVVEGNTIVERDPSSSEGWASEFSTTVKGKGRAVEPLPDQMSTSYTSAQQYQSTNPAAPQTLTSNGPILESVRQALHEQEEQEVGHLEEGQKEDPNDAYFRQDNADYAQYWHNIEVGLAPPATTTSSSLSDTAAWDQMQQQWDQFEATTVGIKPVQLYQFHPNNPYLLGQSSSTHQHSMHLDRVQAANESVLELEAAVQRNPHDAGAWYELGVRQQENEREHKAVQALQRAVELDPTHLASWLALAISHGNDSNRAGTYAAMREWVDRNDKYRSAPTSSEIQAKPEPSTTGEQFNQLIERLIMMARSDMSVTIDADIQIALAVLLNTNEDFVKAQDCFRTALAVRPDDWLLYNRVGATMANNGNAEEALQYYYRALELNPNYIRARFNLGISCINLRRYDEAAHHILDALVLQDSDSVPDSTGANIRGVTSTVLWESLRTTCMHMQRADLAALCGQQDLEGFRTRFFDPSY